MKKTALLLFIVLLGFATVKAQYRYSYFRVGVSAGVTNYLGDLDDDLTIKYTKPGLGLQGAYRFSPNMEARFNFFQGWLGATDANSVDEVRQSRSLSFRSPVTEGSFTMAYNMFSLRRGYRFRPKWNPYIFAGVGIYKFNPQAQIGNVWFELQPLGTEGQYLPSTLTRTYPKPYALTQVCIPMGIGTSLTLNRNWDLLFETGFRKLFTDYLDDVSGRYPDMAQLAASNPTAAALSLRSDWSEMYRFKRGDKNDLDWYIYTSVTATYIIDWVKCPQPRGRRR